MAMELCARCEEPATELIYCQSHWLEYLEEWFCPKCGEVNQDPEYVCVKCGTEIA